MGRKRDSYTEKRVDKVREKRAWRDEVDEWISRAAAAAYRFEDMHVTPAEFARLRRTIDDFEAERQVFRPLMGIDPAVTGTRVVVVWPGPLGECSD